MFAGRKLFASLTVEPRRTISVAWKRICTPNAFMFPPNTPDVTADVLAKSVGSMTVIVSVPPVILDMHWMESLEAGAHV